MQACRCLTSWIAAADRTLCRGFVLSRFAIVVVWWGRVWAVLWEIAKLWQTSKRTCGRMAHPGVTPCNCRVKEMPIFG